jgi:tetratricopeptide (TPR) repeat protein
MFKNFKRIWLIPITLVLATGIYLLPPVRVRADRRINDLRAQVKSLINPPDQAVFMPTQQAAIDTIVQQTMQAYALAQTPSATPKPVNTGPTSAPTMTPTPLPASVNLPGVKYVDQRGRWNYCGPANLTMALNFWGWKGNRDDIAKVVKPGSGNLKEDFIERGKADKNVMPYELVDFVNENTEFHAIMRYGGDEDLLKKLIAAGYPPIVEKGYYEADYRGKVDWLGHYLFTTGYDDARGGFIVQDAWLIPGKDLLSDYKTYQEGWRAFNYLFVVVYPAEDESKVMTLLGPWADETWAKQHALDISEQEIQNLSGNDLFYAWFNKGTSHVTLQQYADAATAFDQAFAIYSGWDQTTYNRPYRMMWYQTGPYFAYFYTGRYQDVVNLANTTLDTVADGPTLEESLLWRGRARYMLGDTQSAVNDYRAALKVHVDWLPAVQALADLGLQP